MPGPDNYFFAVQRDFFFHHFINLLPLWFVPTAKSGRKVTSDFFALLSLFESVLTEFFRILTAVSHFEFQTELPAVPTMCRTRLFQARILANDSLSHMLYFLRSGIWIVSKYSSCYLIQNVILHVFCNVKKAPIFMEGFVSLTKP